MISLELQTILALLVTLMTSSWALPPRYERLPVPSSALSPPPPRHFRRGIEAGSSVYAPAFLPTPLPPLDEGFRATRGQPLRQPKKPVYHYTPIKPFSIEDLGSTYRGKGSRSRLGYDSGRSGTPVHEESMEGPPPPRPLLPPTPFRAEAPARVQVDLPTDGFYGMGALIPDAETLDLKNIRLGEAFVADQPTSGVVQSGPSHGKYHFEYRVRDHDGEFGHAEARDGPLTSGGYDVNLRKTHIQSVRYLVDSKEIPRYGYAHL